MQGENNYTIKVNDFEGPLDLLVHLIEKNKMDIYNIEIVKITEQYIEYINKSEELNLDLTSEFLVMASTLLYIKSKMLLPKKSKIDEDEEVDLKESLINQLVEYKKYKEIANVLKNKYLENQGTYYRQHEVVEIKPIEIKNKKYPKEVIGNLYQLICNRNYAKKNVNLKSKMEEILARDKITIKSKVREIISHLVNKARFKLSELFVKNNDTKLDKVTAFMAVLELAKNNRVKIRQEKTYGEIEVIKNKE